MFIVAILISFLSAAVPSPLEEIESNLGTNFNLQTPVPATTEEFTILESKRDQWLSLTTVEKQSAIMKSVSWEHLSEDQRLFSMLHELGLNSKWSLERVKDEIARDYRPLRDKVGVKWPIGNVKESDATPQRLLWISIVPNQMLNPIENGLKTEFTTRHQSDWAPSKVWTFPDYDNAFQTAVINRILTNVHGDDTAIFTAAQRQWIVQHPFGDTLQLIQRWQLKSLHWNELHDELKFISMKHYFNAYQFYRGFDEMTWNTFQHDVIGNNAAVRTLPVFTQFSNAPEELFWVLSIPEAQRTQLEKGFVNSFGYGHFDSYTSSYFFSLRQFLWDDMTLTQRAFLWYASPTYMQTNEEGLWLKEFTTEISAIFGEAELPIVMGAFPDLQEWMRSYFYRNVGSLTADQKIWGVRELSKLKSPLGIQSFQQLNLHIMMSLRNRRGANRR